jgi:hypothetical protein
MRFSGTVGYAGENQEVTPGVWKEVITELHYYGDVVRNSRRLESPPAGQTLNDDISVENSFSIVADAYAYENFMSMRYVTWSGSTWRVTNVEVRRPRLILTIGGLWNGNTA